MPEEKFGHTIADGQPLAPLFKNGTVIWRSVTHHADGTAELAESKFDHTEKGSWLGRVALCGGASNFIWEPCALPNTVKQVRRVPFLDMDIERTINIRGIAVFINTPDGREPDENWTHLIVTGVSKALKEPSVDSRKVAGAAIFATVAKPWPMPAYLDFRRRLFRIVYGEYRKYGSCSLKQRVDLTLPVWPEGEGCEPRTEECRLLTYESYSEQAINYCHLRQKSKQLLAKELAQEQH